MKEEKKKDDDFEFPPIIKKIALIGAIATVVITMIICFINSGFPDNWTVYIVLPVLPAVLYSVYMLGLYLLAVIISLPIVFILYLFEIIKNKLWRKKSN